MKKQKKLVLKKLTVANLQQTSLKKFRGRGNTYEPGCVTPGSIMGITCGATCEATCAPTCPESCYGTCAGQRTCEGNRCGGISDSCEITICEYWCVPQTN